MVEQLIIQYNYFLRIILALLIIPIAKIIVNRIKRIDASKLRKGKDEEDAIKVQLLASLIYIGGYLAALAFLFLDYNPQAPGFLAIWYNLKASSAFLQVNGGYIENIAMLIGIWAAAVFIIRYFSNVFLKLDAAISTIDLDSHVHHLIKRLFGYVVYAIAAVVSLSVLGLDSWLLTILTSAGIAGIVIGFAARDTVAHLISGVSVILDKPFKIGDSIDITDKAIAGVVEDISMRSTKIRTFDNRVFMVPNSVVANSPLINYSISPERRFELSIGIAYEANIDKAQKLIREVIMNHPVTSRDPSIRVAQFAASSVDLSILIWLDSRKGDIWQGKSQIAKQIKEALDTNGIEIPYPKQVLIQAETNNEEEKNNKKTKTTKKKYPRKNKQNKRLIC